MAAQWRPDLFLLDLAMPDMTGWDLAARLRTEDTGTDGTDRHRLGQCAGAGSGTARGPAA